MIIIIICPMCPQGQCPPERVEHLPGKMSMLIINMKVYGKVDEYDNHFDDDIDDADAADDDDNDDDGDDDYAFR